MMPDPLDVAFAALGNDGAASILAPQLQEYDYAGDLQATRRLVDAHEPEFWDKNLYNHWLSTLRTLSTVDDAAPTVARTQGWNRRILNTQLASWAQLRHDTLLYAKQSYTSDVACEFPDAYVDPYPEFYAAMRRYAEAGAVIAEIVADKGSNQMTATRIAEYYQRLANIAQLLEEMATNELQGIPFTDEHMAFINRTVNYVDTCTGPRAYAGLASSYYEKITENYERLTDQDWEGQYLLAETPSWLRELVAPQ